MGLSSPNPDVAAAWFELGRRAALAWVVLPDGAKESELATLERNIGQRLPSSVRQSYLLHDGIERPVGQGGAYHFLSVDDCYDTWQFWTEELLRGTFDDARAVEADDGVLAAWYSPTWLPISVDGCGNMYCVDLAPSRSFDLGQVIFVLHDSSSRRVRSPGLLPFLLEFVDFVEVRERARER